MKNFNDKQDIRLTEEQKEIIHKYVNGNPDLWESHSHFIRSAILSFIREQPIQVRENANKNNTDKQTNDR